MSSHILTPVGSKESHVLVFSRHVLCVLQVEKIRQAVGRHDQELKNMLGIKDLKVC